MRKYISSRKLSRRDFLKLGGGLIAGAAAARFIPMSLSQSGEVARAGGLQQAAVPNSDLHLAASGGLIPLRVKAQVPGPLGTMSGYSYNPNPSAPDFNIHNPQAGLTTYVLGFRDVTGMSEAMIQTQKMKIQASAPLLWVNQGSDYLLALSNLGLQMQPDLLDSPTVHWHGFRNTHPIFDDEPISSLAVPIGRTLTLSYKPHDPGTYMYHCRFEGAGDVQLGMTGAVFVRPIQDGNPSLYPSGKYAYNDGDGTTGFDREFALLLTNVWAEAHWENAHYQLSDWTGFKPEYLLLNGRVYPDTLVGNGGEDVGKIWGHEATTGDLLPPPNRPDLCYQPISSLIEVQSGERILLRFVNLTFQQHIMTTTGLKMRVVGRDATLLRGRGRTDLTDETNLVSIDAGQSYDVIIPAPTVASETRFLLYNRLPNAGGMSLSGQMTEIRVHPAGTLAPQTMPNTNPHV
jgi:FtsP/CotA-like multicopper oxidase with cupredoxin domain